jgi:type IV secretory pathway VirB2 component (pilin)
MKRSDVLVLVGVTTLMFLFPQVAYATVESTLNNFGNALGGRILPLIAILGLCYAGFSFVTGSPNAKNHLIYAIIGVGVGLGAKSIVDFIRQLVQ